MLYNGGMLISKYGWRKDYQGRWDRVPVERLNNSRRLVLVRCDDCGTLFKTLWNNRKRRTSRGQPDYCGHCAHVGRRNSQHGRDRKALTAHARTFLKANPMLGRHHDTTARAKMSERKATAIADGSFNIQANNRGRKAWYESVKMAQRFFADSGLERLRMVQLDADPAIKAWTKRHGIKVPYSYAGLGRYCVPDFLITYVDGAQVVEEVKGRLTDREQVKAAAIASWCEDHGFGFRLVTQRMLNEEAGYQYRKFIRKEN